MIVPMYTNMYICGCRCSIVFDSVQYVPKTSNASTVTVMNIMNILTMFARPSLAFPLQMEMVVKVKSAGEGLARTCASVLVGSSLATNVLIG